MNFTYTTSNDEGEEITVDLPGKYVVCDRCHGEGHHVNPAIDGNGISSDDECWQDDDFSEGYFSGRYDVRCEECNGERVVLVADEDRCTPEQVIHYSYHMEMLEDYRLERAAEMRWGY